MFGFFKSKRVAASEPISLYNTASKEKEVFESIHDHVVTMYSCGPTVYDHIHIGNLRAYLLPDLLTRLFLYNGYKVESTINFTDFGHLSSDGDTGEDKMMKGMKREGFAITLENMLKFAEPYIESFKEDNEAFGNLPPTNYARASSYIKEQKKLVETLEQKGYTYETSDGIYFDISKFPEYGVLGNLDLDAMKAGARVAVNEEKRHPADFALWKKGELGWNSKWGLGFPGWHIECAAMAFATLGKEIDIHTGGEDLMYTHHNGEIAEAECATGKQYVNYWLHNAHITIAEEKISKSSGNGIRLSDLKAKGFSPLDYRYWLLQSHYRTSANFTFEALEASKQALARLKRFVYEDLFTVSPQEVNEVYEQKFVSALEDDLDTPKAVAILWELVKDEKVSPGSKLTTIHTFDSLLSLGLSLPMKEGRENLGIVERLDIPERIQNVLEEREAARQNKDWAEADRLRQIIETNGYMVDDTKTGPKLTRKLG